MCRGGMHMPGPKEERDRGANLDFGGLQQQLQVSHPEVADPDVTRQPSPLHCLHLWGHTTSVKR